VGSRVTSVMGFLPAIFSFLCPSVRLQARGQTAGRQGQRMHQSGGGTEGPAFDMP